MKNFADLDSILQSLPSFQRAADELKETLLANLIMIGEVPAPTFGEAERVQFLRNRFTENGLQNCSTDEKGSGLGLLPGQGNGPSILLLAHADTVFGGEVDHTVRVLPETVMGPGLGDNSLGVAVLATLPTLLEKLDIRLSSDLLLMAVTRSLGRGDLEGVRFFLDNNRRPIRAAICIEGARLGRLSCQSIGMVRSEVTCSVPDEYDWTRFGASGAIIALNRLINKILEIPRPIRPRTSLILGSIRGGASFSTIATSTTLRFEVLSESADQVARFMREVESRLEEVVSETGAEICLKVLAHREPAEISFSHPLVTSSRQIMDALSLDAQMAPSTSELSVCIDHGIPAITLGIAHGRQRNKVDEELEIPSISSGLAQLLGIILAIDGGFCDER